MKTEFREQFQRELMDSVDKAIIIWEIMDMKFETKYEIIDYIISYVIKEFDGVRPVEYACIGIYIHNRLFKDNRLI